MALNKNFLSKVSDLVSSNVYGDLTTTVEKYLEYAKKINTPPISASALATKPLFGSTAPSSSLQFSQKPAEENQSSGNVKPEAPKFSFGQSTSGGSLFGLNNNQAPKQDAPTQSTGNALFGSTTSSNKPLFGSSSTSAQPENNTKENDTSSSALKFNFGTSSAPTTTTSKGLDFGNSTSISTESAPKPFSFGSSSTSGTPSAPKPFVFGNSSTTDSSATKPVTFGSTVSSDTSSVSAGPKPFTFGSLPTNSSPGSTPFAFSNSNNSDSIGSTAPSSTSTSAPFKFNGFSSTSQPSSTPSNTESSAPKSLFNFGSTNKEASSESKPSSTPFKFGSTEPNSSSTSTPGTSLFGSSTPAAGKPLFGGASSASSGTPLFGNNTTSGASLFGGSSNSTDKPLFSFNKPAEPATNSEEASTEDDAEDSGPSADFTDKGPGEEDEDTLYEKKSKIYEVKQGKPEVLGVGILRVLKHKESGKSRVVVRAEGGGRVILNSLLRSSFSYASNGPTVNVTDILPGGEFSRFMVRVKTPADAEELSKIMEDNKV